MYRVTRNGRYVSKFGVAVVADPFCAATYLTLQEAQRSAALYGMRVEVVR